MLPSTTGTVGARKAPVVDSILERRRCIMANLPGTFVVQESDVAPGDSPLFAITAFEEVSANSGPIEALAKRYALDPDFVRAIVWIETTHGYYDRLDPWNNTIRPMNVHYKLWGDLGISRKSMADPTLNLAAGVHILSMIWERTERPTVEKVATLYNELGAKQVNRYGKSVAEYMRRKPWLRRK